jgi:hypothetical protein
MGRWFAIESATSWKSSRGRAGVARRAPQGRGAVPSILGGPRFRALLFPKFNYSKEEAFESISGWWLLLSWMFWLHHVVTLVGKIANYKPHRDIILSLSIFSRTKITAEENSSFAWTHWGCRNLEFSAVFSLEWIWGIVSGMVEICSKSSTTRFPREKIHNPKSKSA